jgi:hypothetical protein
MPDTEPRTNCHVSHVVSHVDFLKDSDQRPEDSEEGYSAVEQTRARETKRAPQSTSHPGRASRQQSISCCCPPTMDRSQDGQPITEHRTSTGHAATSTSLLALCAPPKTTTVQSATGVEECSGHQNQEPGGVEAGAATAPVPLDLLRGGASHAEQLTGCSSKRYQSAAGNR